MSDVQADIETVEWALTCLSSNGPFQKGKEAFARVLADRDRLAADNARLKREVEQGDEAADDWQEKNQRLLAECDRLAAELARAELLIDAKHSWATGLAAHVEELEAEARDAR